MNKNKPLDQVRSTGVNAPNRTSKLVNKLLLSDKTQIAQ